MSELKLRPPKRLLKNTESQLQGLKPFSDDGAYGGV